MKTCEERLNAILAKTAQQRQKRRRRATLLCTVGCLLLAIGSTRLLPTGVRQTPPLSATSAAPGVTANRTTSTTAAEAPSTGLSRDTTVPSTTAERTSVPPTTTVRPIAPHETEAPPASTAVAPSMGAPTMWSGPPVDHYEEWPMEKVADYFGRDFRRIALPEGLSYYSPDVLNRKPIYFGKDGSIIRDNVRFNFADPPGAPACDDQARTLLLEVGKVSRPIDYRFPEAADITIRGTAVHLLRSEPLGDCYNVQYAVFFTGGLHYFLDGSRLTAAEFDRVLDDLIP